MMKKFNFNILFIVTTAVFISTACQTSPIEKTSRTEYLPYYNEASFTPLWLTPHSKELSSLHQIPDFELTNQNGESISAKSFENKIYVADFFFTSCPGICPKMTKNMHAVQAAFVNDDDVLLLSHSVTPQSDSVSVLKAYAQEHQIISGKWHLVTGSRQEIYKLGRQSYFVEEDLGVAKANDEFLHTENFVLVDKNKHIRGIYNGLNKSSIEQLIADINTLKEEK